MSFLGAVTEPAVSSTSEPANPKTTETVMQSVTEILLLSDTETDTDPSTTEIPARLFNGMPFECPMCQRRFRHERTFFFHVRHECPNDPRLVHCIMCSFTAPVKLKLKEHMAVIHGIHW